MIKPATADHIQDIVDLGAEYYANSRFAQHADYNAGQAYDYIRNSVINAMSYVDVLVERDTTVGFLLAHAGPQAWSANLACNVTLFYIDPEHRGNGWETVFVERVEAWASEHNMDEVIIGDYAISPDRTQRLTERMGYETVGYIGAKRV